MPKFLRSQVFGVFVYMFLMIMLTLAYKFGDIKEVVFIGFMYIGQCINTGYMEKK